MPKLAILADPISAHTIKWVKGLSMKGFNILLIGITDKETTIYNELNNVQYICFKKNKAGFIKVSKLIHFFKIKKAIKKFDPDILHSFYASSYGFIGALTKVKPYLISVWGSDVYHFPNKSFLHKLILKYSFKKAEMICATGTGLKTESLKYTQTPVKVIPFGINTDHFKPKTEHNKNVLTIGTVKHFDKIYGIDILIKAFHKVVQETGSNKLKLILIGDGKELINYKKLTADLKIDDQVDFLGYIKNEKLPIQYNQMDLVVISSLRESFGISVLEAMSCEIPVIASDISGFREVGTNETITYFNPGDINDLTEKIKDCILNYESYLIKAKNARKRVIDNFSEPFCVEEKVNFYSQIINSLQK